MLGTNKEHWGAICPHPIVMLIVALLVVLLPPKEASSQSLENRISICQSRTEISANERIENCTKLLESNQLTKQFRSNTLTRRGFAYAELGRHVAAVLDFEQSILIYSNNAVTHYAYGLSLVALEKYTNAYNAFSEAIRLDEFYARAYFQRAKILLRSGHSEAATDDLTAAILIESNEPMFFKTRSLALYTLEKYDLALADINYALKLAPDDIEAHEMQKSLTNYLNAVK